MQVIRNKDGTHEEAARLRAFDELEMLVESIDNACNLHSMHLWPEVLACLAPEESQEVARLALWIIGTAAQNNPATQSVLLEEFDIVAVLLRALEEDRRDLKAKVLYALTANLSNSPRSLEAFVAASGFARLQAVELEAPLKEKAAFLLQTLSNEIGPDAVRCLCTGCPRLLSLLDE